MKRKLVKGTNLAFTSLGSVTGPSTRLNTQKAFIKYLMSEPCFKGLTSMNTLCQGSVEVLTNDTKFFT